MKFRAHPFAITLGIAAATVALVTGGHSTAAFADAQFKVAWTHVGIYPRSGPSMESTKVGAALPDGTTVTVVCEQEGQSVTSDVTTSSIWELTSNGTWLPNAFVETHSNGWTPGVPRCDQPETSPQTPTETPFPVSGIPIKNNGSVYAQLYSHYYDRSGTNAVIEWSFFQQNARLMDVARSLKVNEYTEFPSNPTDDGTDYFLAMGTHTIWRTSQNCFRVKDTYDFAFPYVTQVYDAWRGNAKVFTVYSSGCI
ncbi:hypothetical protein N1031_15485 [Herbiconiux moechotypicola]|uniref:SH3b domain-containing protein n=1 Tax=Herbiconiux moechotypicola TaxID=637393 RepID=A0ABN3DZE7_9MICO|nr:hypothetical protein [Herbiconiux moechotypicola]MCS5731167.1 hypothetical protein [Herbiconiux moechotypicola]